MDTVEEVTKEIRGSWSEKDPISDSPLGFLKEIATANITITAKNNPFIVSNIFSCERENSDRKSERVAVESRREKEQLKNRFQLDKALNNCELYLKDEISLV